ncbi:START domain-containing protein [Mucilaginibacter pedocola]|uniref:Lipid-binding protein n=1 Tax=Mucilaginibacter pedocola TaxID=1792845 RepID=A0A1S9P8J2_9SPHI|nr:START domain-containing protein [Mucilaginibacter pedocola]OOQ57293.1 lipid-binding protein [Mucilaginibacter pedocola]
MYKYLFSIIFLLNITAASAQYKWTPKTEKDGIKVFTSIVEGSKIKAVKVEADLDATPAQLVKVLLDVKGCTEWVSHTKLCTLVKQVSPSELYYYSEIDVPWPVSNRDFVAHLTVHQNPETKVVTVDGPAVPGFVPVKEGIVRISESKGEWILTPLEKDRVRVVYTLQVNPGGSIPAWLINLLAAEGPINSFQGLKKQLKKPQYAEGASFIKD